MDVVERAARLREDRVPHVLATVVQARQPSSGKPGDRAIVTADRRVEGWVGGACAETVVADEALAALSSGRSRYLVLDASATEVSTDGDRVTHPLTCHSGGAIELFIEPFAPPLAVGIVGDTPVARVLAALCAAAGYEVSQHADPDGHALRDPATSGAPFVVVATMGRADEDAARDALLAGAPYVAVVASRRRAAALREWLAEHDVPADAIDALHSPAGLDLGARDPAGVAISILAEIAAEHARIGSGLKLSPAPGAPAARDPVCGMSADPARSPTAEHDGLLYAFCGVGCRDAFVSDPSRYLDATERDPEG